MANTTKDGEKPVELPKTNEEQIVARYEKGENLYSIANGVYEFVNEDAVERVRQVLRAKGYLDETHVVPETKFAD